MFAYLNGIYQEDLEDGIVLDVHGVGYAVFTSRFFTATLHNEIKLYTYYHVREDVQALYGFLTLEEKRLFELLISVSGVGPKLGMQIMSTFSPLDFYRAVYDRDIRKLTEVKGLGKKGAERLVVELQDKIKEKATAAKSSSAPVQMPVVGTEQQYEEVMAALCALGFTRQTAEKRLADSYDATLDVNMNVVNALRGLSKHR